MSVRRCLVAAAVASAVLFGTAHVATGVTPQASISGSGWGHGVGLSQYGAKALALDGSTYKQILERYFTGVTIGQLQVSGSEAFIFDDPEPLWVGLLQDQQAISFSIDTNPVYLCYQPSGFCVAVAYPGETWRFAPDGEGACRYERLTSDRSRVPVSTSGPCAGNIEPVDGSVSVTVPYKARTYSRGLLRFREANDGRLNLSLEMSMDDYLRGLAEVPDSWPTAAIEAQVVASRSLLARELLRIGPEIGFSQERSRRCHCHILDRSPDPNYRGTGAEASHPAWLSAVSSTTREVVSHLGTVANTLYSSSSGGRTEDYDDVFGGSDFPYLATVHDGPSLSDVASNPHRSWVAGFPGATLAAVFEFSWVSDMEVIERNASGSARTVAVSGIRSGRPVVETLTGVAVRSALSLRSTTFDITANARFDDVPTDHQFAGEVVGLDALAVTTGCSPTEFCPDRTVTRAEMAAFLTRALGLVPSGSDPFTDDDEHGLEAEIGALAASGITSGCSATSFCPDRPVTRAEMAAFLVRGFGLATATDQPFADAGGNFFEAEIGGLAASGITSGCSATSFCPDRPVTRAEMAAFLIRAIDR